jgi:hypothetical protein
MNMATNYGALVRELEEGIKELEIRLDEKNILLNMIIKDGRQSAVAEELKRDIAGLKVRIDEKRKLSTRLSQIPRVQHRQSGKRISITALGKIDHYETDEAYLSTPGDVLDHFDQPHYFSNKYPGRKDEAAREIIRWARNNPIAAKKVRIFLADGEVISLLDGIDKI